IPAQLVNWAPPVRASPTVSRARHNGRRDPLRLPPSPPRPERVRNVRFAGERRGSFVGGGADGHGPAPLRRRSRHPGAPRLTSSTPTRLLVVIAQGVDAAHSSSRWSKNVAAQSPTSTTCAVAGGEEDNLPLLESPDC
uniref:Uncharacterized protein n=1 Tax=Aegilops tauschii subsp. strangulata TaxID=200361 RepID=A0A453G2W3_AEGTS